MVDLSIKNGGSFQFVLCKRLPEALFIRVLIVISSHPVPSSPPVASNRPGSCSPQSLEPLLRNRPARAHRPHTVWGRNRNEERTWWTHAIFRKKTKEKCWDFSHPNKYQPYSPLFEMGMGHKLQGNLLALTSQHSWASHSKRCSSRPSKSRAASVEKPIPNPWNHVFLEEKHGKSWEMGFHSFPMLSWRIETLKTWEMVMKPPTCCHTKSLVAHQIVNVHGDHHW